MKVEVNGESREFVAGGSVLVLLAELDEQTTLTTQLLVLLVRFLFASMLLTSGLILVSSGLGNRRLLAILDSMLEQQDRGRAG